MFLALVVTGVVHVVRRNVLDVVLFFGMCGLILVEQARPPRRPRRRLPAPPVTVLVMCLAYGVLMWPLAQGSWPMRVLVALPGMIALVLVLRAGPDQRTEGADPDPPTGWWLWPSVLVVAGLFELGNFLSQQGSPDANPDHPTLTAVVDPFFTDPTFRAVFSVLWLAAGFWLVRTVLAPDREVSA